MAARIYRVSRGDMHSLTQTRGGAMYSSGTWIVKKGHEEEFARIWQIAADRMSLDFPGVTFRLLRDAEDPRRFVALSGAWRSAEQIASARSLPSFQELMTGSEKFVESSELSTFELVTEIS
jgi:heme-degrading monooxygenase HmoA